jgi:hypothetical protein
VAAIAFLTGRICCISSGPFEPHQFVQEPTAVATVFGINESNVRATACATCIGRDLPGNLPVQRTYRFTPWDYDRALRQRTGTVPGSAG